jgi:F0F1-type ATP synthase beta subunit
MKITLVQSEIELAIRQYVGSVMMVADGMSMDIDLAATRAQGTGFTATIDIVPTKELVSAPKTIAALGQMFNLRGTTMNNIPKTHEPEKTDEPVSREPETDTKEANTPFETSTIQETGTTHAIENAPIAVDQSEGSPAPSPSRSLFGALKKPKNN